jgi:hyaluronan synthase
LLTSSLFALILIGGIFTVRATGHQGFAVYGSALGVLMLAKLTLSLWPTRPWLVMPEGLRVAMAVPVFNEDPTAFARCLASIDRQTHQPDRLVIVDDASSDTRALSMAREFARCRPWVDVVPTEFNQGKRHALGVAFRAFSGRVDIWITVDSDTVLEPGAIDAGLRPFTDTRIQGVTGTVIALNGTDGILPALIDLRYTNAFLGERAAYSRLGAVLCACGSLAFWRAAVIEDNLDDFLNQQFLGQRAEFGDDRRLTRYALDRGRVVLARDAVARTAVPQRFHHFIRQQVRWGKSFWRESLSMLLTGRPSRVAWWLSLIEIGSWLGFSIGLLWALVYAPMAGHPGAFGGYLGWVAITAWARSVHAFTIKGRGPYWQTLLAFLIAPLYGLMSLVVLVPLRAYSMLTLRVGGWGTRQNGPETELTKRGQADAHH